MSNFLLIAPGDWRKVDRDTAIGAMALPQIREFEGSRSSAIHELTDAFRAAGLVSETEEIESVQYVETTDEIWIKYV